jgi:hypothetical protein
MALKMIDYITGMFCGHVRLYVYCGFTFVIAKSQFSYGRQMELRS